MTSRARTLDQRYEEVEVGRLKLHPRNPRRGKVDAMQCGEPEALLDPEVEP